METQVPVVDPSPIKASVMTRNKSKQNSMDASIVDTPMEDEEGVLDCECGITVRFILIRMRNQSYLLLKVGRF